MIHLNLIDGKKLIKADVPEHWNELTAKQLIDVASVLTQYEDYPLERDIMLVQALCNVPAQVMRKLTSGVVIEQLFPLTEWIKEGCDLTKQLIPAIRSAGFEFYGPSDFLGNLTVGEFDFAERALFEWHMDMEDSTKLFRFLANIYRPAKPGYDLSVDPDGDCREKFNPNVTPYYAKLLQQNLEAPVAVAIVMWYKGCRADIVERYRPIFRVEEDDQEPQGDLQPPQYFDLMRAIAKEGIYGDFEKVFEMPLYTALQEMLSVIEENQRIKEELEKQKNENS